MSRTKGLSTVADYLSPEELQKLFIGLHNDKLYLWEAYCKISYITAFRISDLLTTKWGDIIDKSQLTKIERKTQKARTISFNSDIVLDITQVYKLLGSPDQSLLVMLNPKTQKAYSREYINRMLKYFRMRYKLKIKHCSTHTFRKAFARNSFEANGSTMKSLFLIQKILNHTSPELTLAYMGYVQEDINVIYNTLPY